jgi:AmmeMemoRadiSam system protein A
MADRPAFDIPEADGKALVATAREARAARVEGRAPRWPSAGASLSTPCGAFVTLRGKKAYGSSLRGCIGRMTSAESLLRTVREMALAAAFEDPRFPPLEKEELPRIDVEVTVLSPMRPIAGVDEIEVGKHGVLMSKGGHSAVFLPQVAAEQGWDRGQLLDNLCYKAGLTPAAWRSSDTRFQVFEGRIFAEGE